MMVRPCTRAAVAALLMGMCVPVFGQQDSDPQIQEVRATIDLFFQSLEAKDSVMMRQSTHDDAQVWRRYNNAQPVKIDFRFSRDDLPTMHALPDVREVALDYIIQVQDGIATAMVPYEFWIEDRFSHCGSDAFTLLKVDGSWKIVSVAYTIEKEDCGR
ncbi:MAG: nuclear transport factor 2 family protein [Saprospiraceae bacterium]|nr:nuclear transport factor 2 family protein [Saprospiraceae bacterium]